MFKGHTPITHDKPPRIYSWNRTIPSFMFVDESGDHNLGASDPNWPILVICGVIVQIASYLRIKETLTTLKRELWPPDGIDPSKGKFVCFHSRDMRMMLGPFSSAVLSDENRAKMDRVIWQDVVGNSAVTFRVVCCIIDKERLRNAYLFPENPYLLAVTFLLERLVMNVRGPCGVLFESRGKREDRLLWKHIGELFQNGSTYLPSRRFVSTIVDIGFHPKRDKAGMPLCGFEVADLCAYTLGAWYLRGKSQYSEMIVPRLLNYATERPERCFGSGLKIFPDIGESRRRALFDPP